MVHPIVTATVPAELIAMLFVKVVFTLKLYVSDTAVDTKLKLVVG